MTRMLRSLFVRLNALVFRRASDADLDEELRYHLEREIERHIADGMTPDAARESARRAFGNMSVAAEQARDAIRWRRLEELRQDVSYALRTFRRAPLFVVTIVTTIGLGLGLLSSAFTFFDAYVLRPLAVRDPLSLYDLSWSSPSGRTHRFTWSQYERLRAEPSLFSESFGYVNVTARLRGRPVIGQLVTGNYFQMLGVPPAIGRVLLPGDADRPGASAVVVLSHRTWETIFGGDTSVIGTSVALNGTTLTIVGVARAGFSGLTSAPFDFWIPITLADATGAASGLFGSQQSERLCVVGRLLPGVNRNRAASMLSTWLRQQTADRPALERVGKVVMLPRGTSIPRNAESIAIFGPVIAAFLLVMLIACANVANLMLARGMARQREIGIRLALGAGRRRLVRQLLTESIVLAVPAGVAGFFISRAAIWLGIRVMFATVPRAYAGHLRLIPLDVDLRVLVFTVSSAILSAVLFGLAPALQATRPNIVHASRGDFDTQFRPSRLRNTTIVAQITFSVVLLICAGVLLSGTRHIDRLSPGIRTQGVVQIELFDKFRARALVALQHDRVVSAIASSSAPPLDGRFNRVGLVSHGGAAVRSSYVIVTPQYFSVLDLPIISGRDFTDDEARSRASVAIVSEATAKRFWPNHDPIGETIRIAAADPAFANLPSYHAATIIGVTRNSVPGWIGEDPRTPTIYYPQPLEANAAHLIVRVRGDADRARVNLEHALATVDSTTLVEMHTLDESLALQVYPFRAMYWVASGLAAIALLLTTIGVYGVIGYLVAQRRKEFSIRIALGAAGAALVSLVLRDSLRLALIGAALGLAIALCISRLFATVIFNLNTFDAFAYLGGIALVLATCAFASYAPSRRAAAVDPADVLRAE